MILNRDLLTGAESCDEMIKKLYPNTFHAINDNDANVIAHTTQQIFEVIFSRKKLLQAYRRIQTENKGDKSQEITQKEQDLKVAERVLKCLYPNNNIPDVPAKFDLDFHNNWDSIFPIIKSQYGFYISKNSIFENQTYNNILREYLIKYKDDRKDFLENNTHQVFNDQREQAEIEICLIEDLLENPIFKDLPIE